MIKITDIHTHILYGVDDGAKTLNDSMDLISEEWNQGVRRVFLTPHYGPMFGHIDRKTLENRFQEIQKKSLCHYPDMELYLGSELYYERNTIRHLQEGKALTMAGSRYVLIEFGGKISYRHIFQAVYDLVCAGYLPILAHVERYDALRGSITRIRELRKSGAYVQVNAGSFLEGLFSKTPSFCKKLAKEELIYFLGSDCHDMGIRSPNIKKAYEILNNKGFKTNFSFYADKVIGKSYI